MIEAVRAMGGNRWTIIREVLIPEALPGIIAGFTVTLVTLIGASAMAGAIGAGGLGDLAIRYGYQRFETGVMIAVVVVLIVLVCAYNGSEIVLWNGWIGDTRPPDLKWIPVANAMPSRRLPFATELCQHLLWEPPARFG